jgi:hypothetical protein
VVFEDDTDTERKSRCIVWMDWRGRSGVSWISDDVGDLTKLPIVARIVYVAIAVFLIQFGIRTLVKGESIYQFSRRWPHSFAPIPIGGRPAVLLSLAALCAACRLLLGVAFHYDGTKRGPFYGVSARAARGAAWTLFWLSIFVFFYQQFKGV